MSRNAVGEKLGPEWSAVAALSDELKHAWLTDHFTDVAMLGDIERRQQLRELIEETGALPERRRTGLIRAALLALLDLDDLDARVITHAWSSILDRQPQDIVGAERAALHDARARLSSGDAWRLSRLWPQVFGSQLAATA